MERDRLAEFDNHLLDGLEFCSKVYALFEEIRNRQDGPSRLRMRPSPLEKKLLEELLPICNYVQTSYRIGRYISVRWINGNQTYDAAIEQRGAYVSKHYYPAEAYLEVTCAMHPKEYLKREMLERHGHCFGLEGIRRTENGDVESVSVGLDGKEFIAQYAKLVLDLIQKKTKMPYPPDTTLIVQCTMNTVYMLDEWKEFISRIKQGFTATSFREIYFYDNIGRYSETMYPSVDT